MDRDDDKELLDLFVRARVDATEIVALLDRIEGHVCGHAQSAEAAQDGKDTRPEWMIVRQRTLEAVQEAQAEWSPTKPRHADIAAIIDAAIDLEAALYASRGYGDVLFRLRHALQGVFGHDYGDEEEEE